MFSITSIVNWYYTQGPLQFCSVFDGIQYEFGRFEYILIVIVYNCLAHNNKNFNEFSDVNHGSKHPIASLFTPHFTQSISC